MQDDLDDYVRERTQTSSWDYAQNEANRFVKLLTKTGAWSQVDPRRQESFGVVFDQLPAALRTEIKLLLDWKTAPVAPGRQRRQKTRKISALNVRGTSCLLYGYAYNIHGTDPQTLRELVSAEVMYAFVTWYMGERGAAGRSAHVRLVSVLALFRQHPLDRDHDVTWLKELIDNVPLGSEMEEQERRAAKQVPYAQIESIPGAILKTREQAVRKGSKKLAWTVQVELLMLWLTVLPWRQRNLRECRIGGKRPNLFKSSLENAPAVAKPDWVREVLDRDPKAEFWQFRFAPDGETKNGRGVHAVLPRPLCRFWKSFCLNIDLVW